MKLVQINDPAVRKEFEDKGYVVPSYDRDKVRQKTAENLHGSISALETSSGPFPQPCLISFFATAHMIKV